MSSDSLRIGIMCYPTYGGSGAVATELGRLLARRGHTIHFLSYARPFRLNDDYHENIFHHEIPFENYELFLGQLYTISGAVQIHELVNKVGLDVLHLHYALPHAISAWMAMEMLGAERRIPTVTTLHGTDITLVGSKPSFLPAVQLGLDKSDRLTAVSHWLSKQTCRLFQVCDGIEVIHNFVDPEVYRRDRGGDRAACQRGRYAADDEKLIVHISNFRPVKRLADVVTAFARVAAAMPARLVMIGDGPDREQAARRAEELGVADRVLMLGKQPAVECFLAVADLFLFPSAGESFGLAALEAMACETPVVAYRAGGIGEVVVDGETGALVELEDTEALGEACVRILSDSELRRKMGKAARKRAIEEFSSDRIIPQYEQLYRGLLSASAV
jgi:N-acetyl-alpha-D-glucosaminyl L-malate synthase BshA